MVTTIRQDHSVKVSEYVIIFIRLLLTENSSGSRHFIAQLLNTVERDEVEKRKQKKFRRRRYYCAGVGDLWCFDQHDKWKHFGLWPHVGLDPFSGQIVWLKIWWTNRNPKLITSYYLGAGRKKGGIPLITQSDPGSENYGTANFHMVTRQRLDPTLDGTLQHKWMKEHGSNVKPEIIWSLLRHQWTPGFETILDVGLDAWVKRFNSSQRRADKHKILPKGIPDLIAAKPHLFGTHDYKVHLSLSLFGEMEENWAPPTDQVFELVPPAFHELASTLYLGLNSPPVTLTTFWEVYIELKAAFLMHAINDDLQAQMEAADASFEFEMELLADQAELRNGANVVAGFEYAGGLVNAPPVRFSGETSAGLAVAAADHEMYVDFTSSEEDD
ncbi:hypothetical protein DFH09DRAFT_948853 [Mycena vulgaris]|nr:hypothetical protein DFH09DRAFT_948853 [Mycena vulgaris]